MATDTRTNALIINELTEAEFQALVDVSDTEIYLTPDDTDTLIANAITNHNTASDAHSNIRGVANGVATLTANGKVPLSQIDDSLLGNVAYQGSWDASTGTAPSTTPKVGQYWITSVAGTFSSVSYEVGDWIICGQTSPSVVWNKIDNTDAVSSVNSKTGVVVLDASDIGLGNVDNTSDADKPVSTAQQTALDTKQDKISVDSTLSLINGNMSTRNIVFRVWETIEE